MAFAVQNFYHITNMATRGLPNEGKIAHKRIVLQHRTFTDFLSHRDLDAQEMLVSISRRNPHVVCMNKE